MVSVARQTVTARPADGPVGFVQQAIDTLKQRGAARRCPVCHLIRLGIPQPRPADLFAFELGARVAGRPPEGGMPLA
jgi:hypothetical protein